MGHSRWTSLAQRCTLPLAVQYMDKTYVKSFHLTPVYPRALEIFTEEVVRGDAVGPYLKNLFLQQARPAAGASRIPKRPFPTQVVVVATSACSGRGLPAPRATTTACRAR